MPVVVNRTLITDAEIIEESARVEAEGISARREEAARQLAIRELLQQQAHALGLDTKTGLDRAIEQLLAHEVSLPEVDEAACRRYYDSNPERFCTPVTLELRHILLKAAPDDPEERATAEQQAERLVAELQADPSCFAALAAQYSACPSASDGGHLGFTNRGQTIPEFEQVVTRLAERPVESRYGFHVVEVLSREGSEPLAFADVQHLIADYLQEASWRRAVHQYIQILIYNAGIKGIDFPENSSPLIQ